jgi:hypothetical protein
VEAGAADFIGKIVFMTTGTSTDIAMLAGGQ